MPFFYHNRVRTQPTMTSKFNASYLKNVRENRSHKTGEENFYHSTGEYCGLALPNPLKDRTSVLTCQPGPGYHDVDDTKRRSKKNIDRRLVSNHSSTPSSSTQTENSVERQHKYQDVQVPSPIRQNVEVIVDQPRTYYSVKDGIIHEMSVSPRVDGREHGRSVNSRGDDRARERSASPGRDDRVHERSAHPGRDDRVRERPAHPGRDDRVRERPAHPGRDDRVHERSAPPGGEGRAHDDGTFHDRSNDQPSSSGVNTVDKVCSRSQEHVMERIDKNVNKTRSKHPAAKPPEIQIITDHAITCNVSGNNRQNVKETSSFRPPLSLRIKELKQEDMALRNPCLGVAFPRPHSLDVPEKKSQIKRTLSAPELSGNNDEKHCNDDIKLNNTKSSHRHVKYDQSSHSSQDNIDKRDCKAPRSRSLPSVSLPRNFKLKTPSTRDTDPLRYFAYLGQRFQFRERLPSTHNFLSARPVILTSTSVISPEVSTNFRDQLEDYDGSSKYEGTCQDLIDCCTCMCCIKAVFYHCTKDDYSEGEAAEHPCSCSKPVGQCLARWSIMGLFTACMPCLLCYLPIQGCKRGVDYFRRKNT